MTIACISQGFDGHVVHVNPRLYKTSSDGWLVKGNPVVTISWDASPADIARLAAEADAINQESKERIREHYQF